MKDFKKYLKLIRFVRIYGISRTIVKIIGRVRPYKLRKIYFEKRPQVSLIGCGQFGFSTISYFVSKLKGNIFYSCFDTNISNSKSLKSYFGYRKNSQNVNELLSDSNVEILYIASNHASHAPYAIEAIENGIERVYIEKPIATSFTQLESLLKTYKENKTVLYAGYNRPYSSAIKKLRKFYLEDKINSPMTLSCFVTGHLIPSDHWYRNEEEGTRICGNMGHWIDLMIHVLLWRSLPESFNINITYSNVEESDDNLTICIVTERFDLIVLTLTSRDEPFDGINETINFQAGNIIAKIDDFRSMKIWKAEKTYNYNYFPKDVGHKNAINQPFDNNNRNFNEVIISTLLMLHIADMVKIKKENSEVIINDLLEKHNV